MYNDSAIHSMPIAIQLATTALLQMSANLTTTPSISVSSWPWPTLWKFDAMKQTFVVLTMAMWIGFALIIVVPSFAAGIVWERQVSLLSFCGWDLFSMSFWHRLIMHRLKETVNAVTILILLNFTIAPDFVRKECKEQNIITKEALKCWEKYGRLEELYKTGEHWWQEEIWVTRKKLRMLWIVRQLGRKERCVVCYARGMYSDLRIKAKVM